MNKIESLELFKQGVSDWNAWACELLDDRAELESAGKWMGEDKSQWNDETRFWHKKAKANFSDHTFWSDADFSSFHFPGEVSFKSADFQKYANFECAVFNYDTNFREVVFSKICKFALSEFAKVADFSGAEFKGDTNFDDVTFLSDAKFYSTIFGDEVSFDSTDFKGSVSFEETTFSREVTFKFTKFKIDANFFKAIFSHLTLFDEAQFEGFTQFEQCSFNSAVYFVKSSFKNSVTFKAVSGKGSFSLYNVNFSDVPDFTEAHFEEAPQFDKVELNPERYKQSQVSEFDTNYPTRWRALRRLAIQDHDHERELQFFKGEIISRRGIEDNWTHARFWFGWLYQLLSDFGRSMGRPLLCLGFSLLLFAVIYAYQNSADWYQLFFESASCIDGPRDSRIYAALGVSVIHTFPFAAISSSELLNQYYACLYGIQESSPVIPYVVTFVGIIQFFVSAVLLFLFLLAVRNNFRIK